MKKQPTNETYSINVLTAAALLLPGLLNPVANAAEEDSVDFQYSHYQEGKRDIYGMVTNPSTFQASATKIPYGLNPIEVDSIHGSSRVSLTDRIKFSFNYTQDTWSGATPVGTAPAIAGANNPVYANIDPTSGIVVGASPYAEKTLQMYLGKKGALFPQIIDLATGEALVGDLNKQLTHVISYASPETRKQGDFKLSYEWDEAAVNIGGGLSLENDYESRFVNLGGKLDFNNKQTTVNFGLSYTNSDTQASLDPKGLQFFDTLGYDEPNEFSLYQPIENAPAQIESFYDSKGNRIGAILRGKRQEWDLQLGLSQALNKVAILELDMGFKRSTGYLANPYKLVYTLLSEPMSDHDFSTPILVQPGGILEKRPEERNQFNWHLGYAHYVEPLDAAFHFNYRFAHDDWGINAHTFDADWVQPLGQGWTVTPSIRYYSQEAADFYAPVFNDIQVYDVNTGEPIDSPHNQQLPNNYSSDHRLSGFGTLSGGLILSKQFAKGISLETGFEYYTHQGSLMLGGSGEKAFADYDFWSANAALKVNLEALVGNGGNHDAHTNHSHHQHSASPAGVMFDHALAQAGDMMVGYRFMRSEQAGNILSGSQPVSLDTIKLEGCDGQDCTVAPKTMTMSMHMLDLMYAPTDWLTFMIMPQWMDMEMNMNPLTDQVSSGHVHGGESNSHQTGGVSDTGIYALFKVFDQPNHHLTLSLGGTAPTGDVGVVQNRGLKPYIHYGMQLGSGTWDFKPSLTFTGALDSFSWGAQANGTLRLESRNSSNFAFGDNFQGSVWGGYAWTNWLGTTVRGVYTWQDSIRGGYLPVKSGQSTLINNDGPFDQPGSYGGQFVDLGLGVNVTVPSGAFQGNTLKFEWLQPLHTDYNGYQLDRDGSLAFTWSYGF